MNRFRKLSRYVWQSFATPCGEPFCTICLCCMGDA